MGLIFISHSEKDLPIANEIIKGLEDSGYSTWYFERDIVPGTSYITQIAQAIEQSLAVILVISSKSLDSDQVSKEVVGAFERRKPFFPVLVDMTPPQLKERQPEWRHALGSTAMVCIGAEGLQACTARIIEGLKSMGIHPEAGGIRLGVSRRPAPTPASYTPKHLADKILAARASLEGERKQVTVLFADVKGFTSISEKLDPEEVHDLISECLVFLTEEIHRYEGTIAQFLGDGLLALFGAPIAHEDAPQRALYAALGMRERLREYALKLKQRGIEFNMRIGLNTGLVVVGRIGDDLTMEYTAMGDTVNLASRIESTADPGTIQVSENTYRLTEGYFEFKPLGEIEVKGKKEPVKAYRLLGVGHIKTRLGVAEMRGLTPFVGRQKELELLMDCYGRAKRGQGQLVGIVGEPGVGKSRLLLQLRSMLPQSEYTYLEGDCHHYGETVAYLPILDILKAYFSIEEGEAEALSRKKLKQRISQLDERLMGMLPPLQELLSLKVEDEQYLRLEPQLKRVRIFEAIWSLLIRESQNLSLVLAVEDLQWIDKTSEEFLSYIIAHLGGARIILILLYRPEYDNPWTSKTYYSQIRVDEFPLETSAEMVQAILKEGRAAPELSQLILKRAAGNPLFMEELTRALQEKGYIERKEHHYVLNVKPSDVQVPDTVHGIIAARIDRLEENIKGTLQVASVIGRDFAYRILQTITGLQEQLKACVLNLQELEFIYEKSLLPELEYMFKHALTQEVAYNSVLLKRRKEFHEKIGKAIEELYPERLEEFYEVLAHHYSRSENLEKAYHYLTLSMTKAVFTYSVWEAYRFGREAINILKRQHDSEENNRRQIEVYLSMRMPMLVLGFPEDSIEMLQDGATLSERTGDERSLAIFYSSIGMSYTARGDTFQGMKYTENAFREAEKTAEIDFIAPIVFDLVSSYLAAGEYFKVTRMAPNVLDLLEKTQKQYESFGKGMNLYSALLASYGHALGHLGNFQEGQALCEKGLRFAIEIDDHYCMAWAEFMYGFDFDTKGDGKNAVEHLQRCIRYTDEAQFFVILGQARAALAWGYYLTGDSGTAGDYAAEAIKIQSDIGVPNNLCVPYYVLGMIHFDSGDLKAAQSYVEMALELSQNSNQKDFQGMSLILLGRLLGRANVSQCRDAEERILQGISILTELKVKPLYSTGFIYLAEHYADTGQREKALETLEKTQSMLREMGMDYWLRRAQKILERLKS